MAFSPAPNNAATKPATSPFNFSKGPVFGDSTSRPKSPKNTSIENPYLKNPTMGGSIGGVGFGNGHSGSVNNRFNSMTTTAFQIPQSQNPSSSRDPLAPIGGANFPASFQQKKPTLAPLPPPNMSLSLMEGVLPIHPETPKPTTNTPFKLSSTATSPAPVPSPPLVITATPIPSSADDHWVVGFGFESTSTAQFQELIDILKSCGMVDQQISGGNWVAVHFLSRYAAEKAVSSQPIYSTSSNMYYGISRVTPERLRILQQHTSKLAVSNGSCDIQQQLPLLAIAEGTPKQLEERDVLMRDVDAIAKTKRPTKPENVCEQFMAWWFGWNYDTSATTASTVEHPKSD
ncbi:hypothetical protein IV203_023350 [Nitzschia inconspicua]|uniref:RRM Nup35-type domain-containing protein n=1 Tax=Nitzschia inconspicua TaxID=303405 RepID=A0A9K3PBI9_9STRA|nr:hypothetical protein IV203_023350 [Nitzschia inconspicua]